MVVMVSGIIEKEGKYLLVQEACKPCYKQWSIPAGELDSGESISEGAIREIKEETGFDVEVTGICQIGSRKLVDDLFISIVFTTKILKEEINLDKEEILDAKWFSYEEILQMESDLRSPDLIIHAITNAKNNTISSLEILKLLK
jgi:ADP-ribose pyrophosphatase YjhB (NUDIX family)